MTKNIKEIFDIKDKDIISFVGAGGKTSLIFYLSKKIDGKIIITTTTKMFMPSGYNVIFDQDIALDSKLNEVIVTAHEYKNGKICGINKNILKCDNYDNIFIEADGSKSYPLKGWNSAEPVIISECNKTIGIVDITVLDKSFNYNNIFRLEELKKITNASSNITQDTLKDVIINEQGLFKNSAGEKILFINKAECDYYINKAVELSTVVYDHVDRIVIGSIRNQEFLLIKGERYD